MGLIDRDRWRLLEPLLDDVLDLPAEQRESWMAALREQSPALAAELTLLLSVERDADQRGFLMQSPAGPIEGLQLGPYVLERQLGQGGMGTVWLARRTDGHFEGRAAVKLLNPGVLGPRSEARFRHEGSVLARLTHPGIARLMDAGVSATGQPYMILEYVDGVRIDRYVEEHNLSIDERIGLVLDILAAVGHAHANLIVHRDIKPSNILVTSDGTAKLLDFGIAKLIGDDVDTENAITQDITRILTPEFAAPEQVSGEPITTATDVYAAGVLLYMLVSGRHPTAIGCRTPADAVRALRDVQAAPLGMGDLDSVLAMALHKEPGRRYQTVTAFADDLKRYLQHEPVRARRDSFSYRARKFVRRHRASAFGASIATAAVIAAVIFSITQMRTARRQRDAAVYQGRRADAEMEFQAQLMSQIGDKPITMREILDRARGSLEKQFASNPRLLTQLLLELSDRYAELDDSKVRGSLLAKAESLATATGDIGQLIETRCSMVDNLRTQGRYDEAYKLVDSAQAMLRVTPDPRVEVTCLQARADLEDEAGPDHDDAVPSIRRAIFIRDSLGETRDMQYVSLLSTYAGALTEIGDIRQALKEYEKAMALLDSTGRGQTATRTIVQHDDAVTRVHLGEVITGEEGIHGSIVRMSQTDPSGSLPWQPLIHYAHAALFERQVDSAQKYFALLVRQGEYSKNNYWIGRGLFGLAQVQIARGDVPGAQRSVARFDSIYPQLKTWNSDDQLMDPRFLHALLVEQRGDTAAAHQLVVGALRDAGYFNGARRAIFRSALMLAGNTALALGNPDEALDYARAARDRAAVDSLTLTRSAFIGEAELIETRAMLAKGDSAQARAIIPRATVALRYGAGSSHPLTRDAEQLLAALATK